MNAALSADDVDDRPTIPLVRPRAVEPLVGGGMLARAKRARREMVPIPMVSSWTFGAGMARPRAFHGGAVVAVLLAVVAAVTAYVLISRGG